MDGHRGRPGDLKGRARCTRPSTGRKKISDLDIALAAELALPHRIKRGPFHQTEITVTELQERISEMQQQAEPDGDSEVQSDDNSGEEKDDEKKKGVDEPQVSDAEPENHSAEPAPQEVFNSGNAHWWDGGQQVQATQSFTPRKIDNPLDKMTRRQSGRRSRHAH